MQSPPSTPRPTPRARTLWLSALSFAVLGVSAAAVVACAHWPDQELGVQLGSSLRQATMSHHLAQPRALPSDGAKQIAAQAQSVSAPMAAASSIHAGALFAQDLKPNPAPIASGNHSLTLLEVNANISQAHGPNLWPQPAANNHGNGCPRNMARIGAYCIDRYEASLVERLPGGLERPHPYYLNPGGLDVRAVSEPNVYPQAHISAREAKAACAASGKRLCKPEEWRRACHGSQNTTFPYGETRQRGVCNDHGRAPLQVRFKGDPDIYSSYEKLNDPALNQIEGTLARAGEHEQCTNEYGVYDMVGNIHEWVDDPRGMFLGGYYLDTTRNGPGCNYTTDRHRPSYHDYSTGFRCCADAD